MGDKLRDAAEQYLAAVEDGSAGTPEMVDYFENLFREALNEGEGT